jgi:hypothetical protein
VWRKSSAPGGVVVLCVWPEPDGIGTRLPIRNRTEFPLAYTYVVELISRESIRFLPFNLSFKLASHCSHKGILESLILNFQVI